MLIVVGGTCNLGMTSSRINRGNDHKITSHILPTSCEVILLSEPQSRCKKPHLLKIGMFSKVKQLRGNQQKCLMLVRNHLVLKAPLWGHSWNP